VDPLHFRGNDPCGLVCSVQVKKVSHYRLRRVAALATALLISGCIVANTPEPQYVTQVQDGAFEVRRYGPRVVAETTVKGDWNNAGNEGFRRLAGYIFGKNRRETKIAMTAPVAQAPQQKAEEGIKLPMTAPVAQQRQGDAWTVAFTMPEGETLQTLPAPQDPRVVLREVPPMRVAVVRFSGRWTDANMKDHEVALRRWADGRKLTVTGEAEVNRYDPPFKPWFLRRNEVWLPLAADSLPNVVE
jgi:hypothetical protein